MDRSTLSKNIKQEAQRLGFQSCGIAKAEFLEEEAPRLERWLQQGRHGTMSWMENHFDKRLDPRLLVPGAQSVISVTANYYPARLQAEGVPKVAKYAYGEDYHFVLKRKLKSLLQFIQAEVGEVHGRAFTDSAPVMDRVWAERAGLGWHGKNTLTLSRKHGSFFVLGELIIDLPLAYDIPVTDHCGTCTRCIDACPTDAIVASREIDASRCISYLTIELRDEIEARFQDQMNDWLFGCDICQDVCPWNRFSQPHQEEAFTPADERFYELGWEEWREMEEETFRHIFKNSPLKRAKFSGIQKNLKFLRPQE